MWEIILLAFLSTKQHLGLAIISAIVVLFILILMLVPGQFEALCFVITVIIELLLIVLIMYLRNKVVEEQRTKQQMKRIIQKLNK